MALTSEGFHICRRRHVRGAGRYLTPPASASWPGWLWRARSDRPAGEVILGLAQIVRSENVDQFKLRSPGHGIDF